MFTGEGADNDGNHAGPEQPERDKPKDYGEKLVEINLTTLEGESQPILVRADLPLELR